MDWTWYLFRFDGRINRAKFWPAVLVLLGLMMSLAVGDRRDPQPVRRAPTSFHFGAEDLFKLVDPDAYRSLTSADRPGS